MTLEPLVVATDDFAAFVEPHLATLTWLAARLAPGEHEGLVQQAMTRAWFQRPRFDPEVITERAWLCLVLIDQSRRTDRRPGSERPMELVVELPDGAPGEAAAPTAAEPVDLGRALDLLTAPQRLAVDCHHLVGLSVAETAAVMGCSVGATETALSDARLRLHRALALEPAGAKSANTEPCSTESDGTDSGGTDSDGTDSGGTDSGGTESRGTESDGTESDRVRAAHRWIDALLRAGGVQFRAGVPPAMFEGPSSRMSVVGRRAKRSLIGGIAVAVVGIVVAGAVTTPRPVSSLPTTTSGDARVQGSVRTDEARPRTSGRANSAPPRDVGPAARVVGMRPGWPDAGLIEATASAAGAAGGVRAAWEVATGELLVGIPESLLCNDKQFRLRLDSTTVLHLDLFGGIGPDVDCARDSLRVFAFAPLDERSDSESTIRVTGTTGTLLLPGLSGLELDRVGTGAGLPSVSSLRMMGTSPDVDVRWQPRTGRLLVAARGCGAFATADLGNGTEVTVVIRPTGVACAGRAGTETHVIQIPPHPPEASLSVVVFNSTADRSATTDVFTVPATLLPPGSSGAPVTRLVDLTARQQELTGADRIGRSADNTLHFEFGTARRGDEVRVPTAQLVSDQMVELRRGTERLDVRSSLIRTVEVVRDIPSVSDVHRPLVVRIGDEQILLPVL